MNKRHSTLGFHSIIDDGYVFDIDPCVIQYFDNPTWRPSRPLTGFYIWRGGHGSGASDFHDLPRNWIFP